LNVMVSSIDETLAGTVKEVSTSAQQTGGQYLVKIALDKTEVTHTIRNVCYSSFPCREKGLQTTVF